LPAQRHGGRVVGQGRPEPDRLAEGRGLMPRTDSAVSEVAMDAKARPVKATVLDDDRFRLLAIPFGGPIPKKGTPRGVDLDGEWFSERTDIKADWLPWRPVDWHHGGDETMARTVIGKADHLTMDEDGWWVEVWLKHGERRLELIRRLAEQAAQTGKAAIYGSSESIRGFTKITPDGEILVW